MEDGVDDAEMSRCCAPGTPGTPDHIQPPTGRLTNAPGPATRPPPYIAPAPIASPNAKHGNAARLPCRIHVDCTRIRKRLTGGCPDLLLAGFWCAPWFLLPGPPAPEEEEEPPLVFMLLRTGETGKRGNGQLLAGLN